MFFSTWLETAKTIEEDYGKEVKCDFYDTVLNYSLYGTEPELSGAIKYVWPTIKEQINQSVEHRSKGFQREDKESSDKILTYKNEHPESSQRKIAEECGCSVGKVNKTLKNVAEEPKKSDVDSEKKLSFESLDEETIISMAKDYKDKMSYNEIRAKYKIAFPLNMETMNKIVDKDKEIRQDRIDKASYSAALKRQEELNKQLAPKLNCEGPTPYELERAAEEKRKLEIGKKLFGEAEFEAMW